MMRRRPLRPGRALFLEKRGARLLLAQLRARLLTAIFLTALYLTALYLTAAPASAQPAGTSAQPAGTSAQPAGASAQPAETAAPPATARTAPLTPAAAASLADLLRKGAAAAASEQYETCVEVYATALALDDAHTTAGELGICEEALGNNVRAYDHLLAALAGEVRAGPLIDRLRWKRYHQAYARVTLRVARVFIFVSPNEAEVFADGKSFGRFLNGRIFAVTPGEHTWTARLDTGEEVTVVRTFRGGDVPDVTLALPAREEEPTDKAPPPACGPCKDRPAPDKLEPPCAAAQGAPMSPALCRIIEDLYRRRVNPLISVALGGLVSAGFTADPGFGIHAGVGLHWNDKDDLGFVLLGEVRGLFPALGGFDSAGYPTDVSMVSFGVAPCVRYRWALGCAIVDVGMTFGSPALDSPFGSNSLPVVFNPGVGPRLGLDLPIAGRFGLRAFADLRISPLRDVGYRDLGFDNKSPHIIWENPIASGLFGLGVTFK